MQRSSLSLRWIVLLLSSLLLAGSTYSFDVPSSLFPFLQEYFADSLSAAQYALLHNVFYSVYSIPNVVMPLVGGALVDTYGAPIMVSFFMVLLAVGQALWTLGVTQRSISLMLLGRLVFGLGGESTAVAQSAVLTQWFAGGELAFALGASLSVSRLGSVVNDIAEPHIARTVGLIPAVWTSVGVCVVAAGCATLLLPLERAARRWGAASLQSSTSGAACTNAMQWDAMRAVTTFKRPLWLIVALVVCVYGVVIPFNSVAVPLICPAQAAAEHEASHLMAVPYLIGALMTPVAGLASDRVGGKASMMAASCAVLATVHTLATVPGPVTLPANALVLVQGAGYGLFAAAVWPCIPLAVPEGSVGTAFGLVTAVQNLGLALIPLIVGALRAISGTFRAVEALFALLAAAGVAAAVALYTLEHAAWTRFNEAANSSPRPKDPEEAEEAPLLASG